MTRHLSYPLTFAGGRFASVDQADPAHVTQCAEVILRTQPGDFEATPEVGLRNLIGTLDPAAPAVLEALTRFEPRRTFLAFEDESRLAERVRHVMVELAQDTR